MSGFSLGVYVGVAIAVLVNVVMAYWKNYRDRSKVIDALKRNGYHQITLDGFQVKLSPWRWSRDVLIYGDRSFGFELSLAKVPRLDSEGREWRPFIVSKNGGRALIQPAAFSQMVVECGRLSNETEEQTPLKDVSRSRSSI